MIEACVFGQNIHMRAKMNTFYLKEVTSSL